MISAEEARLNARRLWKLEWAVPLKEIEQKIEECSKRGCSFTRVTFNYRESEYFEVGFKVLEYLKEFGYECLYCVEYPTKCEFEFTIKW